jgi:hypothetical protein
MKIKIDTEPRVSIINGNAIYEISGCPKCIYKPNASIIVRPVARKTIGMSVTKKTTSIYVNIDLRVPE